MNRKFFCAILVVSLLMFSSVEAANLNPFQPALKISFRQDARGHLEIAGIALVVMTLSAAPIVIAGGEAVVVTVGNATAAIGAVATGIYLLGPAVLIIVGVGTGMAAYFITSPAATEWLKG